jgi:hypothetical protein
MATMPIKPALFLAALVLFETITGISAEKVPELKAYDIPSDTQQFLRESAAQTQELFSACV